MLLCHPTVWCAVGCLCEAVVITVHFCMLTATVNIHHTFISQHIPIQTLSFDQHCLISLSFGLRCHRRPLFTPCPSHLSHLSIRSFHQPLHQVVERWSRTVQSEALPAYLRQCCLLAANSVTSSDQSYLASSNSSSFRPLLILRYDIFHTIECIFKLITTTSKLLIPMNITLPLIHSSTSCHHSSHIRTQSPMIRYYR